MVHVAMYWYYARTAGGHRIWWKKYLTVSVVQVGAPCSKLLIILNSLKDYADYSIRHRLVRHLLLFIQLFHLHILAVHALLRQMCWRGNCCFLWCLLTH
jgi:hypothetical protein